MITLLRILATMLVLVPGSGLLQAGFLDTFYTYVAKPRPITPPTISVLILHDKPGAVVEIKGRYQIYDPLDSTHISSRLSGKKNVFQPIAGGLKWGEEFPGVHQVLLVPESQQTPVYIDGVEYRGSLYIYDIGGTISIVNEVNLENYLESIMTNAVQEPMPHEALSAVAIALRTNALYQLQNPRTKYWAVDASQVGYRGYVNLEPSSPIVEAAEDTRYMVMSTTGAYEGVTTPIPAQLTGVSAGKGLNEKTIVGKLSLEQAIQLAQNGEHAAQILAKAFPGTNIQVIHQLP